MASISPPRVAITLRPQGVSNAVNVEVTYTITFAAPEVSGRAAYREVCSIFGEDNSGDEAFNPGDDDLLGSPLLNANLTVDRSTISCQPNRTFTRAELNEDTTVGAFDELRPIVTLTPIGEWENLVRSVAVVGPQLRGRNLDFLPLSPL
jgi:hypothetical protein